MSEEISNSQDIIDDGELPIDQEDFSEEQENINAPKYDVYTGKPLSESSNSDSIQTSPSAYDGYDSNNFEGAEPSEVEADYEVLDDGSNAYGDVANGYDPAVYATPSKKAKKQKSGSGKSFLTGLFGVIVGAAVSLGAMWGFGVVPTGSSDSATTSSGETGTITINAKEQDATLAEAVATKAMPSVVSIDVYTSGNSFSGFSSIFGDSDIGDTDESSTLYSQGSGVIIDSSGHILTNYHVVEEGSRYIVHFSDDSTAEAEVIGTDETSDLAVLEVKVDGLAAIEVADSSEVSVGQWVMAIGSPFGNDQSASVGIVSGINRSTALTSSTNSGYSYYINMIQTDAAINPGNSGGALVNSDGELIGINAMIESYSGSSSGVGFAIPSNYAMNIATQLIKSGSAMHPYLGVSLVTIDAGTQGYYQTTADSGAYVGEVVSGSPADAAGLEQGDVITKCDGEDITSATELIIAVRSHNIGDEIELTVIRGNEEKTLKATLISDDNK